MENLPSGQILIQIDWLYFLGIAGALVTIAYYAGSRLSRIETSIENMEEDVKDLKTNLDGLKLRMF